MLAAGLSSLINLSVIPECFFDLVFLTGQIWIISRHKLVLDAEILAGSIYSKFCCVCCSSRLICSLCTNQIVQLILPLSAVVSVALKSPATPRNVECQTLYKLTTSPVD